MSKPILSAAALVLVLAGCSTPEDSETKTTSNADTSASSAAAAGNDSAMAGAPKDEMMSEERMATMVGGAEMLPSRNIIENAINSADHTTLVAAITAAGLVETLSGPGPFTVFAPTNDAFAALPAGTLDTLLLPESKETLTKILTAHVVVGDMKAADLVAKATSMGGKADLTTVSGDTLTFFVEGGKAYVGDESGGKAEVAIADVDQSNGVIHVVNAVLLPK
ncbi:MAG: fasciclin domain-containing protein [Parvularculaceae bacterium]|nr:fasciclin domain-containing protein [Parvularculaceae bacterium]